MAMGADGDGGRDRSLAFTEFCWSSFSSSSLFSLPSSLILLVFVCGDGDACNFLSPGHLSDALKTMGACFKPNIT